MRNLKRGFTLVELIVVITILAILGTIGYFSLSGYQVTARDSARVSDVGLITKAIELNKVEKGSYPIVSNAHDVTFSGTVVPDAVVWKEGTFGEDSYKETRRLSNVPTDPLTGNEYAYSTTTTTGEYQVGAMFEHTQQAYIPGIDTSYAADLPEVMSNHIKGNYNGKFITYVENPNETIKNIYVLGVPSILTSETGPVTLQQIYTNKSFVYKDTRNAPGSYSGRVVAKEGIQFAATTTTPVIYEGTNATLSNTAGKVALIENLQTHYKDSSILNNDSFAEIRTLDLTSESDTNRAVALVNTFLTTGQGGLDGERTGVSTSTVATSGGSGGGTGNITSYVCEDELTPEGIDNLNTFFGYTRTIEQLCSDKFYYPDGGPGYIPFEFRYLTNMEGVSFDYLSPGDFPEEIFYLPKLTSLLIVSSQFNSIPQEFAELTNLTSFGYYNYGDNGVPQVVWDGMINFNNLTELTLTSNSLTSLPASIGDLSQLQRLRLGHNSLTSLPASIANLSQLQRLELEHNSFTSLPASIANLSQLQRLELKYNSLTSLPASIGDLSQLQRLELGNNSLTSLPASIGDLSQLQKLDLVNNSLTSLPAEIANLNQLTILGLYQNTGLGDLSLNFAPNTSQKCQAGIPEAGKTMCIEGNGTTIDITIN